MTLRTILNNQLNAWVWPGIVADVAQRIATPDAYIFENIELQLFSGNSATLFDRRLDSIIRRLIEDFTIDKTVLEITKDLHQRTAAAIDTPYLTDFHFTGSFNFIKDGETNKNGLVHVLTVSLPEYQAMILDKPLSMLIELVRIKAAYWQMKLDEGLLDHPYFHIAPFEWLLPNWVDKEVGNAYGFSELGKYPLPDDGNYHPGGFDEAVAIYGPLPIHTGAMAAIQLMHGGLTEMATGDGQIASDTPDNFIPVNTVDLGDGLKLNLRPHANLFSPWSAIDELQKLKAGQYVVDTGYGLIYNEPVHKVFGLYGITRHFPPNDWDEKADLGFLRTPFRRIPRITVHSQDELEFYLSAIREELQGEETSQRKIILYRGQTSEYLVGRSAASRLQLFGDADALEPSILASAVRLKLDPGEYMAAWTGLVNAALRLIVEDAKKRYGVNKGTVGLMSLYQSICAEYRLAHLGLALAQHYGLPSNGIDTTPNIATALSFALTEFRKQNSAIPNSIKALPKKDFSKPSVFYVFALPQDIFHIQFNQVAAAFSLNSRPQKQDACFIQSGWGLNANDATRWLTHAFYINDPSGFKNIADPADIFPKQDEDYLGAVLELCLKHVSNTSCLKVHRDRFYWVESFDKTNG